MGNKRLSQAGSNKSERIFNDLIVESQVKSSSQIEQLFVFDTLEQRNLSRGRYSLRNSYLKLTIIGK